MLLCFLFMVLFRSFRAFLGLKPEGRCWFVRRGGLVSISSLKGHGNHLPKKIDQRIFSVTICVRKKGQKKSSIKGFFLIQLIKVY
jgi:hypothetical protein